MRLVRTLPSCQKDLVRSVGQWLSRNRLAPLGAIGCHLSDPPIGTFRSGWLPPFIPKERHLGGRRPETFWGVRFGLAFALEIP